MPTGGPKQSPLNVGHENRREVRTQFGALCWRKREGKVQVLLVTSRGTGRWIIPKGWPIDGATPAETAATEAFEEAGAMGEMGTRCQGVYSYTKTGDDVPDLPVIVAVFPMKVEKTKRKYPEVNERRRKWLSRKKAAARVDEPELQEIILHFSSKHA